jgi:hypothetical protein
MSANMFRTAAARHPDEVAAQANLPAGEARYRPAFNVCCYFDPIDRLSVYHNPGEGVVVRAYRDDQNVASVYLDSEATKALADDLANRLGFVLLAAEDTINPTERATLLLALGAAQDRAMANYTRARDAESKLERLDPLLNEIYAVIDG